MSSENSFDFYEMIQWIFIIIQAVQLVFFVYYDIRFRKEFGVHDPLTKWRFIFMGLNYSTRVVLRSTALIGMHFKGYTFNQYLRVYST